MMIVQLCCIFFHYLLGLLDRILVMKLWTGLVHLLFWVCINEQILNMAGARCSLVYSEARSKLLVCAYFDRVQQKDSKILAVVADEIIRWSLFPHIMDDHLSCVG